MVLHGAARKGGSSFGRCTDSATEAHSNGNGNRALRAPPRQCIRRTHDLFTAEFSLQTFR